MKEIQVGNTLRPDALFVPRHQEGELAELLLRGELVHLVGSRQCGKSSLAAKVSRDLVAARDISAVAHIELNGYVDGTAVQFERLCRDIARDLGLGEQLEEWKQAEAIDVVTTGSWALVLEDFVLRRLRGRIILIFDELEGLPAGFRDDFLLSIRALSSAAANSQDLTRLSFCLVGSRPAAWLISDPTRTRMNVGQTIVVEDFTSAEAEAFIPYLERACDRPRDLLLEVLGWTEGHPFFTAELVKELAGGEKLPLRGIRGAVERLVQQLYLDPGHWNQVTLADTQIRVAHDEPQATTEERLDAYDLLLDIGQLDYRAADPVHLTLVLDGLAGIERQGDDRFLVPRNEITRRVFDREWVLNARRDRHRAREREGAEPTSVPAAASPGLEDVRREVQQLVARHYELLDDGVEELEGMLYTFKVTQSRIVTRARKVLRLQVYTGLSGLGAKLWEQEVRALESISGTRRTSLPILYEAGVAEGPDLAYTLTETSQADLGVPGEIERIRKIPELAVREVLSLVAALTHLQSLGLAHRNLSAGSVEVLSARDGTPRLRLARFHMSLLLSNLLRRLDPEQAAQFGRLDEIARTYFRRQGREALACSPPERLGFVYDVPGLDSAESALGDVFGLGMIAFQLLVGPLPERELAHAFPETEDGPPGFSLHGYEALLDEIRARTRLAPHPLLADLLRRMLARRASERPTVFEVKSVLQQGYEAVQGAFQRRGQFAIAYMHAETGNEFYKRGWIVHDPRTPEGEDEVWQTLRADLRHARMTYSDSGCAPYVAHPDKRHEDAKYVLLGQKATYFGKLYEDRSRGRTRGIEIPQVFLITFTTDPRRAWRLYDQPLSRRLPTSIELITDEDPILTSGEIESFAPWNPLLLSVSREDKTPEQVRFEKALDWLLDVQEAELTVRQYAVLVDPKNAPRGSLQLAFDGERDRERIFENSFSTFYAEDRATFGNFFHRQSLEEYEGSRLLFRADRGGRPGLARTDRYPMEFARRIGDETIEVRCSAPGVPPRGWLMIESDVGSWIQLQRQIEAADHLSEMPNLIGQLIKPRSAKRIRRRWPGAADDLEGERIGAIIRKMLDARPFFALQGPPGTGKTTVTARAVTATLEKDRSARILVSAQSHYALDNLAAKIVKEIDRRKVKNVSALRIASELGEHKIEDDRIRDLLPKHRVDHVIGRIRAAETAIAERFDGHPKLIEIAAQWRRIAPAHSLEVLDRLRRGANILFATTGTATNPYLGLEDESAVCDWAIVEEAGKAWPTELAIPLVQAQRWTLIGDQKQLPPFGKERILQLLDRCGSSPDPAIRAFADNRDSYVKTFELFGNLFEPTATTGATDFLDTQFRMYAPIGETVSKVFYDSQLKSHATAGKDALEIERPAWLRGHAFLWIDSGPMARETPTWSNQREVELVKKLIDELIENNPTVEQLAVLSPYRQQVQRLTVALGLHAKYVHTVDSFQGKEADVVVISLVRVNNLRTSQERLGFLTLPNRINVLLSRARRLLILVGSYDHFKDSGVQFWEEICAQVMIRGGGVDRRFG